MRLKSYFAATVEAAVALARQELGPDALLMKSRAALPEARYLGDYEVVFAAPEPPPELPSSPHSRPASDPAPTLDRIAQEVAELRRQLERTAKALTRTASLSFGATPQSADISEAVTRLAAAEISPELVQQIADRLGIKAASISGAVPSPPASSASTLLAELQGMISMEAKLGKKGAPRRIVALVGPPGVGKTATLVKLAARYGLTTRRPSQLLSLDCLRVGATEQLRSYAAILGISMQALETTVSLSQALEEYRSKDLILIDTPGYGAKDIDTGLDLAAFLSTHPEIDVHLVLTATTKSADLFRAAERFLIFHPAKLVFTRCDETESFGAVFDACVRTGLPVSFFGTGQQIPEDLEPGTYSGFFERLLGENLPAERRREPARAAA